VEKRGRRPRRSVARRTATLQTRAALLLVGLTAAGSASRRFRPSRGRRRRRRRRRRSRPSSGASAERKFNATDQFSDGRSLHRGRRRRGRRGRGCNRSRSRRGRRRGRYGCRSRCRRRHRRRFFDCRAGRLGQFFRRRRWRRRRNNRRRRGLHWRRYNRSGSHARRIGFGQYDGRRCGRSRFNRLRSGDSHGRCCGHDRRSRRGLMGMGLGAFGAPHYPNLRFDWHHRGRRFRSGLGRRNRRCFRYGSRHMMRNGRDRRRGRGGPFRQGHRGARCHGRSTRGRRGRRDGCMVCRRRRINNRSLNHGAVRSRLGNRMGLGRGRRRWRWVRGGCLRGTRR
jgi:hypothetical protein